MLAPLDVALIANVALGAWSAILVNRSIANFHDGLRPVIPELLAGRMSRRELFTIAMAISPGFLLGSIPATLVTGVVVTGLVLIATDVIGVVAPDWRLAAIGGGLWSALVVLALAGVSTLLRSLPIDVMTSTTMLALPLVFAFGIVPAVAVGYQFGVRAGVAAALATIVAWLLASRVGGLSAGGPFLSPDAIAVFVGIVVMLGYAIRRDAQTSASASGVPSDASEDEDPFAAGASQLRRNLVPLIVQGALLGFAIRSHAFGWQIPDAVAIADGQVFVAALFTVVMVCGFMPMLATTALATGVHQTIGLGLVFPVAYLAPHPVAAAVGGAAVFAIEIGLLGRIGGWLDRHPGLRESADSVRTAMQTVLQWAVVAGAMAAAGSLLPGSAGYLIVAGTVALNEIAGQKLATGAVALLALLGVGLVANLLSLL